MVKSQIVGAQLEQCDRYLLHTNTIKKRKCVTMKTVARKLAVSYYNVMTKATAICYVALSSQ
ncbi:MAG: hypothetical protein AUJ54_10940 [Ignavibacteria bacterium CG1_02_37_35]|nr:MAG: hypothetical protein AUJ54_10940 [Ignavibacteria bacterium CG1_02_37_35]PIX94938.1 MAG: hypothetical protein COZ25_02980 [Ignavibacteria bacterium CG_4_10_14_3_um_filter_37_18]PJC61120.1 MAG: hypothetical protein CO025_00680 [Ignavibacteria bacterium CG_4_9_14_0_2_um_filter_37_13]